MAAVDHVELHGRGMKHVWSRVAAWSLTVCMGAGGVVGMLLVQYYGFAVHFPGLPDGELERFQTLVTLLWPASAAMLLIAVAAVGWLAWDDWVRSNERSRALMGRGPNEERPAGWAQGQ